MNDDEKEAWESYKHAWDNFKNVETRCMWLKAYESLKSDCQEWFRATMPQATWIGQVLKLDEETKELAEAIESGIEQRAIEEFADVIIVQWNLETFEHETECLKAFSYYLIDRIEEMSNDEFKQIIPVIRKKVETNKSRQWEYKGNGLYKHVKLTVHAGHKYRMKSGEVYKCDSSKNIFQYGGVLTKGFRFVSDTGFVWVDADGNAKNGDKVVEDLGEY